MILKERKRRAKGQKLMTFQKSLPLCHLYYIYIFCQIKEPVATFILKPLVHDCRETLRDLRVRGCGDLSA